MRCFFALPLSEDIRVRLSGLQQELAPFGRMKLVEAENIHVTLKFLGEVGEGKVGEVSSALESLSGAGGFGVSVKGVGVFPNPGRPRVVWAGVREGAPEIVGLHEKVDGLLAPLGFKRDSRFHPHATLARVKSITDGKGFGDFLSAKADAVFGSYTLDHVELKQSTLTSGGPVYNVLKEYPLQQPGLK